MYQNSDSKDLIINNELTDELFIKYDLQSIDTNELIKKYHSSSKRIQKIIFSVLKERGFDREEIEKMFES